MGPKAKSKDKGKKGLPKPPPENYLKTENKILNVKETTMEKEMQDAATQSALEALEKYNVEREMAGHIKQHFDKTFGPFWQCTVGRNFGSYISYDDYYTYFYLGKVAILLYRNGNKWNNIQ